MKTTNKKTSIDAIKAPLSPYHDPSKNQNISIDTRKASAESMRSRTHRSNQNAKNQSNDEARGYVLRTSTAQVRSPMAVLEDAIRRDNEVFANLPACESSWYSLIKALRGEREALADMMTHRGARRIARMGAALGAARESGLCLDGRAAQGDAPDRSPRRRRDTGTYVPQGDPRKPRRGRGALAPKTPEGVSPVRRGRSRSSGVTGRWHGRWLPWECPRRRGA